MARINLLPWRQERRKQRQKEFFTLLGMSALVAVLIGVGAVSYEDSRISDQNRQNEFLTAEITALDAKIKEIEDLERRRSHLLQRKQVIEQLQANRSQMVHLFDELVRTIPEGVRLNSLKQAGEVLTFDGVAQSNARVSAYMRSLEKSGYLTNPDLSKIENMHLDKGMPYQFSLKVTMTKPKSESDNEDSNADAVPAAGGGVK